jgi:hypothetical protein
MTTFSEHVAVPLIVTLKCLPALPNIFQYVLGNTSFILLVDFQMLYLFTEVLEPTERIDQLMNISIHACI